MAGKSTKSYRLGVRVLIKGRACEGGSTSPCKITQTYFPPPAEALDLGWTPAQMMDGCRRVPQEDLTEELKLRLLAAGLTQLQIAELFCFSRAKRNRIRQEAMANLPDDDPEADLEPPEDDDMTEDDDMAAAIKLASFEEAEQYGIKLPEPREETEDMSMTFAKGLVIGMPAREALEKCLPARPKEITKDLLQICVDGGLNREEIAVGFGTTVNRVKQEACKRQFKFPRQPRALPGSAEKEVAAANQDTALTGTKVEALTDDYAAMDDAVKAVLEREEDLAASLSAFTPASNAGQVPPPEPDVKLWPPETPAPEPEPEPNIWARRFGVIDKNDGPELSISKHGKLTIRRVEMDTDLRYVFDFDAEYRHCRVEAFPQGMKITKSPSESRAYSCSLRQLTKELEALGTSFPARYRLDPETMIGERVGVEA